jgi:hypothetical protein
MNRTILAGALLVGGLLSTTLQAAGVPGACTLPGGCGVARYVSTATVSEATGAAWTSIPGLSVPVAASTRYWIRCFMRMTQGGTGLGTQLQIQGPASPTSLIWNHWGANGVHPGGGYAGTAFHTGAQDDGATATCSGSDQSCSNWVDIFLVNGANAGTIAFAIQSEAATSVAVEAGSFCESRSY